MLRASSSNYVGGTHSLAPRLGLEFARAIIPDEALFVRSHGMFVGKLAMFESSSGVLLCLFVLAEIVMMGRLMVMMRGGVVVSGGQVVMLTRRMLR